MLRYRLVAIIDADRLERLGCQALTNRASPLPKPCGNHWRHVQRHWEIIEPTREYRELDSQDVKIHAWNLLHNRYTRKGLQGRQNWSGDSALFSNLQIASKTDEKNLGGRDSKNESPPLIILAAASTFHSTRIFPSMANETTSPWHQRRNRKQSVSGGRGLKVGGQLGFSVAVLQEFRTCWGQHRAIRNHGPTA